MNDIVIDLSFEPSSYATAPEEPIRDPPAILPELNFMYKLPYRNFTSNKIFILSEKDALNYDKLHLWHTTLTRTMSSDNEFVVTMDDAFDSFENIMPENDALIVAYYTHHSWDYVIKYHLDHSSICVLTAEGKERGLSEYFTKYGSNNDKITKEEYLQKLALKESQNRRLRFIQKLLDERCIIQIEGVLNSDNELTNIRYIKFVCPFKSLAAEAEIIELKKSLRCELNIVKAQEVVEPLESKPEKLPFHIEYPYRAYLIKNSLDSFLDMFKQPFVSPYRHSDIFRLKYLKCFEGGNLSPTEIHINFFKPSQRNNIA